MPIPAPSERLNAAEALVDRHVREGRGLKPAILCGDETVTYGDLQARVNRTGNVLRRLGVARGIGLPCWPWIAPSGPVSSSVRSRSAPWQYR